MQELQHEHHKIMAWRSDGELVLNRALDGGTLTVSGHADSDVYLPELGEDTMFVRYGQGQGEVIRHPPEGPEESKSLMAGLPTSIGPMTWLVARHGEAAQADAPSAHESTQDVRDYAFFMREILGWAGDPMTTPAELEDGLNTFVKTAVQNTPAKNGMLVLARDEGFHLVSSFGLLPTEAHRLWEKMPHSLMEDLLRTGARVLLPEELAQNRPKDSTVLIKGVKSMAGFPVMAEGRVLALFYLGFDNLLRSFSHELQSVLEAAGDLLGLVIQRAQLREQLEAFKKSHSPSDGEGHPVPEGRLMVGTSRALRQTYRMVTRLAPVNVPVLILGETGTGKELAAREIHRLSPRSGAPFTIVNAAAIPESLIESELFGHKKGAFTGALSDRAGLIEQADGGTLFIDEIGELPLPVQAKLLRVLQEKSLTRLGETQARHVDFRLITATHRNLDAMVAGGGFREDLFYRIAGTVLEMPALRERREDILPLANFFKKRFADRHGLGDKEWSVEARTTLENAPWPGNVRELENVVARAYVMADGSIIKRCDVGLGTDETQAGREEAGDEGDDPGEKPLVEARDEWMRSFLTRALKRHGGRRASTAKALGIGERTLFRYIEQYGIRDNET